MARRGVDVVVYERRAAPIEHARAIGIHPIALEALAPLGVVPALREAGHEVRRGRAIRAQYGERRELGVLPFALCPPPYRFVLTVPQHATERILEAALVAAAPTALRRGRAARIAAHDADGVVLEVTAGTDGPGGADAAPEGRPTTAHGAGPQRATVRARVVVACDGRDGTTAADAGISVSGAPYRDTFAMADVAEAPGLGLGRDEAGIFLTPDGVVEAFPLPGGVRRWVVATERRHPDPSAADVADRVRRHVGRRLDPAAVTMTSGFGVERRLAERFVAGRICLCGDAAHVCSPIGGQGMNLGWLDAASLVEPLLGALARDAAGQDDAMDPLEPWSRSRRAAARRAIRRAEFNMALGRPWLWPAAKDALVGAALHTPLRRTLARRFTMRGLATPMR